MSYRSFRTNPTVTGMSTPPYGNRITIWRDQKTISPVGEIFPSLSHKWVFTEDVFQANHSFQCRNDKVFLTWKSRVLIWLSSCHAELTRHFFHLWAFAQFGWEPSRALSGWVLPLHVLLGWKCIRQYSFHLDCPVKNNYRRSHCLKSWDRWGERWVN